MTRCYPVPGSVEVLFVTYGGGHVQMVIPVAKRLHSSGVKVAVFALTTAIAVIEASGLPFFTYADLPQFDDPATQAHGKRLSDDLPSGRALPAIETQAYLGVNYRDLERLFGTAKAADLWAKSGRQIFHPLSTLHELLSDLRPALVVATNSPRTEKAAVEAATSLGIPAVVMVDMFALQEMKWLSRSDFGRHLFVLNESVRQRMIALGRPSTEVTVSGNPAFDSLHDPKMIAAGHRLRADRGWGTGGRFVILWASSPEPELHPFTGEPANPDFPSSVEEELRRIVASDSRLELIIRRHPSEDQSVLVADRITQSTHSDDVSAVIHAVDLVVVTCSTVGLQSYIVGVPVISVEGSVFTKDAPYSAYGIATPVADLPAIRAVLDAAIDRIASDRQKIVQDRMRQSATDRISEAILIWLEGGWNVV